MDYSKQEKFKPLEKSSMILKEKRVAIVGLGGLGSHLAEYAMRMGLENLILIDDDIVEESNLSRQTIYTDEDSLNFNKKVVALGNFLTKINPNSKISVIDQRLENSNIDEILNGVDIVLDGTDNLRTRYLMNEYCFKHGIPWIYGSATASTGTVINFIPGKTPCFKCVFGEIEEYDASCDKDGVILPILTMTASFQMTECFKILLGQNPNLEELRYNIWTREESSVPINIFNNEKCSCKNLEESLLKRPRKGIYPICSGDTIQVNTDYNLNELERLFTEWGYKIKNKNKMIIETQKIGESKIVGFETGKIIFHKINETKVKNLF